MNFNELLKPYKEGGTAEIPIERTMGTIVDYLLHKKGYPLDVVGAAIFTIFFEMSVGREYKGDNSYGSKGRELVTTIRMKCDEYSQEKFMAVSNAIFIERFGEQLKKMIVPAKKRKLLSWWRGQDVTS